MSTTTTSRNPFKEGKTEIEVWESLSRKARPVIKKDVFSAIAQKRAEKS